ncbi:hypothetical protein LOZ12_006236, partial [Ophidiomyces ophidiicola]
PVPVNDRPSFTFIDHDNNLASKRVKDASARKAIRSHVMRDVRRRERLAGLKRVSKRDKKGKTSPAHHPSPDAAVPPPTAATATATATDTADPPASSCRALTLPTRFKSPPSWNSPAGYQRLPHLFVQPAGCDYDPFSTLPLSDDTRPFIQSLMGYMAAVMLPMTFPVEMKNPKEGQFRINMMVKSAISDPGPFFAYMSLAAAHRAIMQSENNLNLDEMDARSIRNPDLYAMKAQCMSEMNKKLQKQETAADESAFETIMFLISAAVTCGFFTEARIHFEGVKNMVKLRGGITSPSFEASRALGGVVLCDVKIAYGQLSRPFYPIAWESFPVPPPMAARIFPPKSSPLNIITSRLANSPYLSDTLKVAINKIRELIFFEHFNREETNCLTSDENEFFRVRVHELEHELLDYPYRIFKKKPVSKAAAKGTPDELALPPIENVTRLACLGYISHNCVFAPSTSGVGRAVTLHIATALSKCPPDEPTRLADDLLDLLAWAAFVGVQSEGIHLKRPWFLLKIRQVAALRRWTAWKEVEAALLGFLYVPSFHAASWEMIWNNAMRVSTVTEES